jgi:hypothetical protein
MKKSQNVPVWLSIIAHFAVAGKWCSILLCPCTKECNKYDLLLLSISDWLIIMIGPGGLLLVVPHLFAVPISVWM